MKESPIFVKTFDFLKWILGRTEKFPKSQRFFLAAGEALAARRAT